ncbi:MAG: hypothetical protein G01um101418_522 [Parcubacteria group bacterium Gr01-1014_18]|nr:MAG: hypothetical protein Greene041636_568 [Parcubacteria group bacterium Greene0416_36]TSC80985.1 MAG: hypothetical protein G01um101418_522 [Parcubacteria group bacterium Gr01-1014_18]TSC98872.1 MAG: hypothetical protein Greene101420_505 [Parcubacteria group bacterium Greene1014_20]TSD06542.1 MAG: hypothetical protein Greene07142_817 [Parcubacteria group bacterium Greene0714_2]
MAQVFDENLLSEEKKAKLIDCDEDQIIESAQIKDMGDDDFLSREEVPYYMNLK